MVVLFIIYVAKWCKLSAMLRMVDFVQSSFVLIMILETFLQPNCGPLFGFLCFNLFKTRLCHVYCQL